MSVRSAHRKRRQATDDPAAFAEKMRMVVFRGATGVVQFIPPHTVAKIHPADQVGLGEVRQHAPYRRLVVSTRRQRPHDLIVSHGGFVFVQGDQHGNTRGGCAQPLTFQERADLFSYIFNRMRTVLPDGRVRLGLKRAWSDGTTAPGWPRESGGRP